MTEMMHDLAKEIVVSVLAAGFTWVLHYVIRLNKDLNANFEKIRCHERRIEDLENELWGEKK